jgi:phospholipid/cholesterol/gamma-HCH transport system ATP-binding protein
VIEFRKVTKRFGSKLVLDQVDLRLDEAEIVFVIGKSGMGKSVLLKHIVGLLRPDEGEIFVENQEISRLPEADFFPIRRRCGMVFQFPALLDSLSVFENVAFGLRSQQSDLPESELKNIVNEKLSLVGLSPAVLDRFPLELSFGTQKRVSIARTLAVDPKYLLFDEPTTGLDPVSTTTVNDLIFRLSRNLRASSLVVSHDMHCALKIADRICLLDGGRVVVQGPPEELIYSQHPLAKDFLREAKEKMHELSSQF